MTTPESHDPLADRPDAGSSDGRSDDPSVGAAEEQVRRSRDQLLDSVESLAERLDVRSRARHRFEEAKQRVDAGARRLREQSEETFTHPSSQDSRFGRPTASGWIALALVGSAAAVTLILTIRAARR